MRILRYPQLKSEKGIPYSREHIRRTENAGKFPKRVNLSEAGGFHGWLETEIDDYLNRRVVARDQEAPHASAA